MVHAACLHVGTLAPSLSTCCSVKTSLRPNVLPVLCKTNVLWLQVFLTHLHSDHIADLATFYAGAMFGRTEPWEVWGPSSEQPELGLNASIAGLRQVFLLLRCTTLLMGASCNSQSCLSGIHCILQHCSKEHYPSSAISIHSWQVPQPTMYASKLYLDRHMQ